MAASSDPCFEATRRLETTAVDSAGRPLAPLRPSTEEGARDPGSPASRHGEDAGRFDGGDGASGEPALGAPGTVPPPRIWMQSSRQPQDGARHKVELELLHHSDGGCLEVFVEGRLRGRLSLGLGTKGGIRASGNAHQIRKILRLPLLIPLSADDGGQAESPGEARDVGQERLRPRPRPDARVQRPPRGTPSPARHELVTYEVGFSRGERLLELRAVGRGTVRLFGLRSLAERPGVVVHNVGVVGAQASNTLPGHPVLVESQLRRLDPALLLLMLGTNDAYDDRLTVDQHEQRLTALIRRLRGAGDQPDCLVLSAPDFGDPNYRKARILRRNAALIRSVQRRVAAAERCAFWDLYAAMGGADSISRMQRAHPPFAYRDRVHLTANGYRALGMLLHEALMGSYAAYLKARPGLKVSGPTPEPGRDPEVARREREERRRWPTGVGPVAMEDGAGRFLGRFFRALVLLSRKAPRAQARVLVIGDSHAAGDLLTGELRRLLQRDFGDAGHGYVHAGAPWPGYARQGLKVGATGTWRYYYLRTRSQVEQPRDGLFGLGGVSTWITQP